MQVRSGGFLRLSTGLACFHPFLPRSPRLKIENRKRDDVFWTIANEGSIPFGSLPRFLRQSIIARYYCLWITFLSCFFLRGLRMFSKLWMGPIRISPALLPDWPVVRSLLKCRIVRTRCPSPCAATKFSLTTLHSYRRIFSSLFRFTKLTSLLCSGFLFSLFSSFAPRYNLCLLNYLFPS
jgi:hypothetical protein